MASHIPSDIKLHRVSKVLTIRFADQCFDLSAEYLRVFSPSAEVRGHGEGQEVLQTGKQDVAIIGIEPQGNYAIKLIFSDDHDSGIYSWDYLYELGKNKTSNWQHYEKKLHKAGKTRDPQSAVVKLIDPNADN